MSLCPVCAHDGIIIIYRGSGGDLMTDVAAALEPNQRAIFIETLQGYLKEWGIPMHMGWI